MDARLTGARATRRITNVEKPDWRGTWYARIAEGKQR